MELKEKSLKLFLDNQRAKYYIDKNGYVLKEYFVCIKKNSKQKILKTKVLKPVISKKGYVNVCLTNSNKKRITLKAHRLVALAFIPNPENKPEVNHKNGIKHDNRVENLEWATHSENTQHAYDLGLNKIRNGDENKRSILTESKVLAIRRLHKTNPKVSRTKLALKLGVAIITISHIINRVNWKHI